MDNVDEYCGLSWVVDILKCIEKLDEAIMRDLVDDVFSS